MLISMPISINDTNKLEPPYEINGRGTPVRGSRLTIPAKLTII